MAVPPPPLTALAGAAQRQPVPASVGHCPFCPGEPLCPELGVDGTVLRCHRCDTEWPVELGGIGVRARPGPRP